MSVMVGSITIHIPGVIISKIAHVSVGVTSTDIEQNKDCCVFLQVFWNIYIYEYFS